MAGQIGLDRGVAGRGTGRYGWGDHPRVGCPQCGLSTAPSSTSGAPSTDRRAAWFLAVPLATMEGMRILESLADLLLGACCPGCHAPGVGLCEQCVAAVRPAPRIICDGPPPVVACLPYRDPIPNVVTAYKDRGAGWLDETLGDWLAAGLGPVLTADEQVPRVVPMPSDPAAVRRRGADHARDLAQAAVRRCGEAAGTQATARRAAGRSAGLAELGATRHRPDGRRLASLVSRGNDVVVPLLKRTRHVRDQLEVSHERRAANQDSTTCAPPGRAWPRPAVPSPRVSTRYGQRWCWPTRRHRIGGPEPDGSVTNSCRGGGS